MRRSPHIHIVIAIVVLLAGGLALQVQNDVGAMPDNEADVWAKACVGEGGEVHYEFDVDGSVKSVTCTGGSNGSWTAVKTTPGTTDSGWTGTGIYGGMDVVTIVEDVTLATELPADATVPLTPAITDQPLVVEAAVTWNPSAEAANQAGLDMVNRCRRFGGTEAIAHPDGNPESASFTVQCNGGHMNGFWCGFGVGLSTCFFEPGTGADAAATDNSTMTPTDAPSPPVAMPTEAPAQEPEASPTAAPTETPKVTPTATSEPTPTDEPVIEPTFEPTDAGPWTIPDSTIPVFEPVEPTPTPVILTWGAGRCGIGSVTRGSLTAGGIPTLSSTLGWRDCTHQTTTRNRCEWQGRRFP
jgi:hypothetical protein